MRPRGWRDSRIARALAREWRRLDDHPLFEVRVSITTEEPSRPLPRVPASLATDDRPGAATFITGPEQEEPPGG